MLSEAELKAMEERDQLVSEEFRIADRRALLAEVRSLRAIAEALSACMGNRGAFSCGEAHDARCPALYTKPMPCQCGAEALEAALAAWEGK